MGPVDRSLLATLPAARRATAQLAAVGVASGIVALAQAVSVAWVVASLVDSDPLTQPLILLSSILVGRGLLAAGAEIVDRRAGHAVSGEVRLRLLQRWLGLPAERRPSPEAAVTMAGPGVGSIEPYVARYLPALVMATVVPILAVVLMFFVDPLSALILIVTLPLLPFFAALIGKHTAQESDRRWSAMQAMAGHFLDVVRGLPTLVAYGRAEHQLGVVRAVGDRHRWASVNALRTAFLSSAALELLTTISVAMVAVAVGLRLAYGTIELQIGLTAILLAPEAYWPIRRVGQEFHNAADGAAVLEQVAPFLVDERPLDRIADVGGPVAVDGVRFGYPDRSWVFDGVSFRTPQGPGLTILSGPSGSGKSTLLDLLAGVRTPDAGIIVAPQSHLATQRPLLLAGSVADALRLGQPDATDDDCRRVLQDVGLWTALEVRDGLDTRLGDDGFGLSAGQRTRLALARARLCDASLVMLDEPTAHVDADDIDRLRQLIVDLAMSRRVIVSTHDEGLMALGDSRWELTADPNTNEADSRNESEPEVASEGPKNTEMSEGPALNLSRWQRRSVRDRLTMACLLGGLSVTAGVALTATSGWLIVQASTQPVVLTLLVAIVGVRAFGIARPVLRYAERVVSHDAALESLTDRRVDVYRTLIPLTPARLGRRHRSVLLSAVVIDLDDAVDQQVRVQVPWWSTLVASAFAVVLLLFVLPAAALALALGSVGVFAVASLGSRSEQTAQGQAVRSRADVLRVTTDLVDGIDEIRAVTGANHGSSAPLLDSIESSHRAQARAEDRLIKRRAGTLVMIWAVLALTTVAVALVAAWGLDRALVSGPVAALVVLGPIALADVWVGLAEIGGARARAREAEARLADVLDQEPAIEDLGTVRLPTGVLPVTARGIIAAWSPEQDGLGPFTLPVLEPGIRAQLIGPNGMGKSTMLAVLARHLSAAEGTHLLAGRPAAQVVLDDARAGIAMVGDEPHAFSGSIRANLTLAAPEATDSDVISALVAADLRRWLERQPLGLDTNLTGLSGGERARLAIARALLSGRELVLLDEPAAHLDDATASRALTALFSDQSRAIVVVSHQPLAAMAAPTIPALLRK